MVPGAMYEYYYARYADFGATAARIRRISERLEPGPCPRARARAFPRTPPLRLPCVRHRSRAGSRNPRTGIGARGSDSVPWAGVEFDESNVVKYTRVVACKLES